jgi:hypothetical protein
MPGHWMDFVMENKGDGKFRVNRNELYFPRFFLKSGKVIEKGLYFFTKN